MKNCALLILAASTAVLGYLYLDTKPRLDNAEAKIANLEATKTTAFDRTVFGKRCVEWLRLEGEDDGMKADDFYLGRSWKKHGQLVFEVIVPKDEEGKKTGNVICTYDNQSGMMFSYSGMAKNDWLFYK